MMKVEKGSQGSPKRKDFLAVQRMNEEVWSVAQWGAAPRSSADALCQGASSAAHAGGAFICRVKEAGCLGLPELRLHLQMVDGGQWCHRNQEE